MIDMHEIRVRASNAPGSVITLNPKTRTFHVPGTPPVNDKYFRINWDDAESAVVVCNNKFTLRTRAFGFKGTGTLQRFWGKHSSPETPDVPTVSAPLYLANPRARGTFPISPTPQQLAVFRYMANRAFSPLAPTRFALCAGETGSGKTYLVCMLAHQLGLRPVVLCPRAVWHDGFERALRTFGFDTSMCDNEFDVDNDRASNDPLRHKYAIQWSYNNLIVRTRRDAPRYSVMRTSDGTVREGYRIVERLLGGLLIVYKRKRKPDSIIMARRATLDSDENATGKEEVIVAVNKNAAVARFFKQPLLLICDEVQTLKNSNTTRHLVMLALIQALLNGDARSRVMHMSYTPFDKAEHIVSFLTTNGILPAHLRTAPKRADDDDDDDDDDDEGEEETKYTLARDFFARMVGGDKTKLNPEPRADGERLKLADAIEHISKWYFNYLHNLITRGMVRARDPISESCTYERINMSSDELVRYTAQGGALMDLREHAIPEAYLERFQAQLGFQVAAMDYARLPAISKEVLGDLVEQPRHCKVAVGMTFSRMWGPWLEQFISDWIVRYNRASSPRNYLLYCARNADLERKRQKWIDAWRKAATAGKNSDDDENDPLVRACHESRRRYMQAETQDCKNIKPDWVEYYGDPNYEYKRDGDAPPPPADTPTVLRFDGSETNDMRRRAIVNAFNDHRSGCRVLLVSITSGGFGINLHDTSVGGVAPRRVKLVPSWHFVETEQFTGRFMRLGTTSPVRYSLFFTEGMENVGAKAPEGAPKDNISIPGVSARLTRNMITKTAMHGQSVDMVIGVGGAVQHCINWKPRTEDEQARVDGRLPLTLRTHDIAQLVQNNQYAARRDRLQKEAQKATKEKAKPMDEDEDEEEQQEDEEEDKEEQQEDVEEDEYEDEDGDEEEEDEDDDEEDEDEEDGDD